MTELTTFPIRTATRPAPALDLPAQNADTKQRPGSRTPAWVRPVTIATAVGAALSVAAGVVEARLPVGRGNTEFHHSYPFFVAALALVLVAIGARTARRRPDSRWARRAALTGLGYTINGILIGILSYSVTPHGTPWVLKTSGWVEDSFFLAPDLALIGLLVGALPDGKLRLPAKLFVAFGVVTAALQMVVPRALDDSVVANPLGIHALKPLSGLASAMIGLAFLLAAALTLGQAIHLAVRSRRRGLGYGRPALGAGLTMVAMLFAQAAAPESSAYLAGVAFLIGTTASGLLASRVVCTQTPESTEIATA